MLEWVKAEGRSVDVEQDGVASTGRKRPGFCTWKCAVKFIPQHQLSEILISFPNGY